MSDELIISGGGSVAVATDEMWGNVAKLQRAAEQLREVAAVLSIVDARLSMAHMEALGVPIAGGHAEEELHCAYAQLTSLANRADDVSALVRTAATSYGWAERFAENASRRVAADAAAVLGFFFPRWVALAALTSPALPVLAALGLAAHLLNSRGVELLPPGLVSAALNEYITDPAFVWALRHAVMSSDEFAAGASGVPPVLVSVLSTAGVLGLPPMAGQIQRTGGVVGILKETPVSLVSRSESSPVEAPHSYEQLVERIPQPTELDPSQIRIERYENAAGEPEWAVYISGTVDFAVADSGEPFDSASNVSNAAGGDGGSFAAVAAAMAEAGISSDNNVSFVGHSQGAGTAARLAASGEYNTQGLLLVGGNTGQIPIPPGIRTVIVEHTDDLVPATGGLQDNAHALLVERHAYENRPLPEGIAVPAHRLPVYSETAQLMDKSSSPELERSLEELLRFGNGSGSATATSYHYEREVP